MFLRKNHKIREVELDEILLDSQNIPAYSKESFEGVVENPISKKNFLFLGCFLLVLTAIFIFRILNLEIVRGNEFYQRAETNRLEVVFEDAERGLIYDRFGKALAKNSELEGKNIRNYPIEGFLHVLGFLTKDNPNNEGHIFGAGASGLEAVYEEILKGVSKKRIEEIDNKGTVVGFGFLERGRAGSGIVSAISEDLQIEVYKNLQNTAQNYGFIGGAAVFLDVDSGEILTLASVPEFDPNLLRQGTDSGTIQKLLNHPGSPFLNRAVSGLYPPGSIVKPAIAAGALAENIIDPEKKILSTGSISLPNPYNAAHPNVFPDWKAHGWVDMRRAIAVSSNVYFYSIGGGFETQTGLGAAKIKKYLKLFGFGEKAGIDLLGEKDGYLPDETQKKEGGRDWTIGDTYNLSIGQGDLLVTPLQMAVYAATIASRGLMPYPHLALAVVDENKKALEIFSYPTKKENILNNDIFKVVRESMRDAVLSGTAQGLSSSSIIVAAKTGTAEVGNTDRAHSWSIGFFPYDNPRIAFAILMDSGPRSNLVGATFVAAETIRWMESTSFLSKVNDDKLLSTGN